jgi:hypothetical protein
VRADTNLPIISFHAEVFTDGKSGKAPTVGTNDLIFGLGGRKRSRRSHIDNVRGSEAVNMAPCYCFAQNFPHREGSAVFAS